MHRMHRMHRMPQSAQSGCSAKSVRLTASSLIYSQGARMESQKLLGSEIEQQKIFGLATGVCSEKARSVLYDTI